MPPGFTWAAGHNLKYAQPSAHCSYLSASPLLTRLPTITGAPRPTHTLAARKPQGCAGRLVSTMTSAWAVITRYQNINWLSIDYACRPRLRTRLTRGRRTWPRNPWSSSGRDPHPSLATHVCILTPTKSTAGFHRRFAPRRTLSYPATMKIAAASSVVCLSPATLSARNH